MNEAEMTQRVKAIREKHFTMKLNGVSNVVGWWTIDNLLVELIRDLNDGEYV